MNISIDDHVRGLLRADAPVAVGVSGGKDSSAVAFAVFGFLDQIEHAGPRLLIHADLGTTEWRESMEWCQRLAARLNVDLIVVRRAKGDMMDRWEQRWSDNVERYTSLRCVQIILPWSTPSMRFCTSEMKIDIICRELSRRFCGQTIVSVSGIRRQESAGRARKPISKPQPKLSSATRETSGVDWHPIIAWSTDDVLRYLDGVGFPLHPAYSLYSMTRVSCAFCIMSGIEDLTNAARCAANDGIYRRMVRLEIKSTFAFQGSQWLGDIAPDVLSADDRVDLSRAKKAARLRTEIESLIPRDLLYRNGWPVVLPTRPAAQLLADVRKRMGDLFGFFAMQYTTAASVSRRYAELWERCAQRGPRKALEPNE